MSELPYALPLSSEKYIYMKHKVGVTALILVSGKRCGMRWWWEATVGLCLPCFPGSLSDLMSLSSQFHSSGLTFYSYITGMIFSGISVKYSAI